MRGKGAWHSYVELHIEQGGTLDKAKVPIGIVEGIVAIHRYDVVIEGAGRITPAPRRWTSGRMRWWPPRS